MPSIVHGYPQIMCSLEKKTNFLCLLYVLLRGHSGLVVSKWFCSTCSSCLCNDCSLSSSCSFSSSFVLTPYFDFSLFLFFCLSFLQYFFFLVSLIFSPSVSPTTICHSYIVVILVLPVLLFLFFFSVLSLSYLYHVHRSFPLCKLYILVAVLR